MRAPVERLPRRSSRRSHPVVLGCVSFAIGGPLIAALVWPAVMLIVWSLIDGPSWEMLGAGAAMAPLVFVASFVFGYFVPATIAGGILGAIGTRMTRRWFVLLGIVVGTGTMVGYVLLQARLLKSNDIGDINVIVILDTIVTSAVMSRWLHRRLERAGRTRREP